jgi:alkylhydroperoxidase/carboxymuconolactone decarboxylase family protein YurZ
MAYPWSRRSLLASLAAALAAVSRTVQAKTQGGLAVQTSIPHASTLKEESAMSTADIARQNYIRVNASEPPAGSSPLGDAAMDFVFGKIWGSPGLSWRERRIISLVCAAISGQDLPLDAHVRGALKSGDFTADELRALSVHLAAYAGFPVATSIEVSIHRVQNEKK